MLSFSIIAHVSADEFENISTRGPVGTGDDLMHAGFVVKGTGNIQVLVKVAGPSLPPNLNGLQDPFVRLFNVETGTLIHQNDNWQTDPSAPLVIATGMGPTDPNEPAFVITLPPGSYTAVVNGVDNTTGTAIPSVTKVNVGTGPKPPNQVKTEKLIGNWVFNSLIDGQPFEDSYKLVPPSFEEDGTYFINGTDMFDEQVIAGYIPEDNTYSLLDQWTSFDQVFLFDFTDSSENKVSGCLFLVLVPSDEVSPCFQLKGDRVTVKSILSRAQHGNESAREEAATRNGPLSDKGIREKILSIRNKILTYRGK